MALLTSLVRNFKNFEIVLSELSLNLPGCCSNPASPQRLASLSLWWPLCILEIQRNLEHSSTSNLNPMPGNPAARDNSVFQSYRATRNAATISGPNTRTLSPTFRSSYPSRDSWWCQRSGSRLSSWTSSCSPFSHYDNARRVGRQLCEMFFDQIQIITPAVETENRHLIATFNRGSPLLACE